MPGTSLGTEEVEQYLIAREQGLSRRDSLKGLFFTNDCQKLGKGLEKYLESIVHRAKALLDVKFDYRLSNLEWIETVCGKSQTLLIDLNSHCLSRGINGIAFNRINILLFKEYNVGSTLSLNMGTTLENLIELDSG